MSYCELSPIKLTKYFCGSDDYLSLITSAIIPGHHGS